MKRWIAVVCMSMLVMLSASMAVAQQSAEPVVRIGNWVEIANDTFINIIGTITTEYHTSQNYDFESGVRDRVGSRSITSSAGYEGPFDGLQAEIRFGADFKYKKNFTARILWEQQSIMDNSIIDGQFGDDVNPGGRSILGQNATNESFGIHVERYWMNYKFDGTPLSLEVGTRLRNVDQAYLVRDDDPRIMVLADFGALDLQAAANIEQESSRIGLTNDNDAVYYTFSAGYDFKPHRVQFDVVYSRDRFDGADTQTGGVDEGFRGQKTDAVNVFGSWKGKVGPVRGLLQGMGSLGTARGGTGFGLPAGVRGSRDYDIFGFGVIAHAELDLGVVKPWVAFFYASGDGDPTDNKLTGFYHLGRISSGTAVASGVTGALDMSANMGAYRGFSCPGRMTGATARPGGNPNLAIGNSVFASTTGCDHSADNWDNNQVGNLMHPGIFTVYSNPGTLAIPAGVRIYPVKGHLIDLWYVYKSYASTRLLEVAYNLRSGSIDKGQVHELGAGWRWTLNPHFYIRLNGLIGIAANGYEDLARLADCNSTLPGVQSCDAGDIALRGVARFVASF